MADKTKAKTFPGLARPRPPEAGRKRKMRRLLSPSADFTNQYELPRYHYKPLDGIDFFIENQLAVTANMAYTTVSTFTLPKGHEGVLKGIVATSTNTTVPSDTRWQLLLNGAPVTGWQDAFNRGSYWDANHYFVQQEVTIFLPTSSLIQLQVRNAGTTTPTAMGALIGWSWIAKDVRFASLE